MTTPQQPVTRDMQAVQQAIRLLEERTARLWETMGEIHAEPTLDTKLREWLAFDGWRAVGVMEAVDILIGDAQWQAEGLRNARLPALVRDNTVATHGRTKEEQARYDVEQWRTNTLLNWAQLDAGYRALREYLTTEPESEHAVALLRQITEIHWGKVVKALKMAAERTATKRKDRGR